MTSDMESTSFVDSEDDDNDFLDTGVDDDNDYDDYTSRISTTTEETSVSRQYHCRNRKLRSKNYFNRNRMSRVSRNLSLKKGFDIYFFRLLFKDFFIEFNHGEFNVFEFDSSYIEFGYR